MGKEFEIEKLKGSDNYHTWSFAVKHYLDFKGYGQCIETVKDKDGAEVIAEKDQTKLTACKALLVLLVEKNNYTYMAKCKTALDVWKMFQGLYEEKGLSRKIGILRAMLSTKLEDMDNMQSYIDAILDGTDKLQGIGFVMTDEWISTILLTGLTENFQPLIMALEATSVELKSELIISKLLDAQVAGNSEASGFFSKRNGKKTYNGQRGNNESNQKCKNCGRNNHATKDCRDKKKCYNCGDSNHLSRDCNGPRMDSRNESNGQGSNANAAFSAFSFKSTSSTSTRDWFIDSGGSKHMTHEAGRLTELRSTDVDNIKIANDEVIKVKSVGDTVLRLVNNDINIHDVLHVPDLGVNLLSVSQIVDKGNLTWCCSTNLVAP